MTYSNAITRRAAQEILAEIRKLPTDDRLELMAEIHGIYGRPVDGRRAKEPLRTMALFLSTEKIWSSGHIRDCLDERGIEYTTRQLWDAIGYFKRIGMLESIAPGIYSFQPKP